MDEQVTAYRLRTEAHGSAAVTAWCAANGLDADTCRDTFEVHTLADGSRWLVVTEFAEGRNHQMVMADGGWHVVTAAKAEGADAPVTVAVDGWTQTPGGLELRRRVPLVVEPPDLFELVEADQDALAERDWARGEIRRLRGLLGELAVAVRDSDRASRAAADLAGRVEREVLAFEAWPGQAAAAVGVPDGDEQAPARVDGRTAGLEGVTAADAAANLAAGLNLVTGWYDQSMTLHNAIGWAGYELTLETGAGTEPAELAAIAGQALGLPDEMRQGAVSIETVTGVPDGARATWAASVPLDSDRPTTYVGCGWARRGPWPEYRLCLLRHEHDGDHDFDQSCGYGRPGGCPLPYGHDGGCEPPEPPPACQHPRIVHLPILSVPPERREWRCTSCTAKWTRSPTG